MRCPPSHSRRGVWGQWVQKAGLHLSSLLRAAGCDREDLCQLRSAFLPRVWAQSRVCKDRITKTSSSAVYKKKIKTKKKRKKVERHLEAIYSPSDVGGRERAGWSSLLVCAPRRRGQTCWDFQHLHLRYLAAAASAAARLGPAPLWTGRPPHSKDDCWGLSTSSLYSFFRRHCRPPLEHFWRNNWTPSALCSSWDFFLPCLDVEEKLQK